MINWYEHFFLRNRLDLTQDRLDLLFLFDHLDFISFGSFIFKTQSFRFGYFCIKSFTFDNLI